MVIHSFDCLMPDEPPQILILGSLPSVTSLGQQQYYAHPQNAFWRIIEALFANGAPCTYDERIELLKQNRIALWDVIATAKREGGLDSAIQPETVVPNDIVGLLNAYPSITSICLNGGTAATLFKRLIAKQLSTTIQIIPLPSTSPANARMGFEEKLGRWGVIKDDL